MNISPPKDIQHPLPQTLADSKEKDEIKIIGFLDLSESVRKHLHAYGLTNGRTVRVISNRPEMIVQIEETELALEYSVARKILVRPV